MMPRLNAKLILASGSPRRAEILRNAGFTFETIAAGVDETPLRGEGAEAYVLRVARAKACAVASRLRGSEGDAFVLAADTIVSAEGELLGKPADADDARRMLRLLSGRTHEVLTGVAIATRPAGDEIAAAEKTRVTFRALAESDIENYISSGEPFDKAGGYGIQGLGGRFIPRIEGCYFNVMGLPLARASAMLDELESRARRSRTS